MTTTPKVLIQPKLAEDTDTEQYKSDNCQTALDKLTATNTSATDTVTITVHLVPAGGAAALENGFKKTLTPGATWPFPELVGHLMESGDTIRTLASTAGAIAIRASGRRFT